LNNGKCLNFLLNNILLTQLLLMRLLLVLHGVTDGFVVCLVDGKLQRKFRNNRVKKISSEPYAVIKRATGVTSARAIQ